MDIIHICVTIRSIIKDERPVMAPAHNRTKLWLFLDVLVDFAIILADLLSSVNLRTHWATNELRRWDQFFDKKKRIFGQFSKVKLLYFVVKMLDIIHSSFTIRSIIEDVRPIVDILSIF